jgi:hypothetical protein
MERVVKIGPVPRNVPFEISPELISENSVYYDVIK